MQAGREWWLLFHWPHAYSRIVLYKAWRPRTARKVAFPTHIYLCTDTGNHGADRYINQYLYITPPSTPALKSLFLRHRLIIRIINRNIEMSLPALNTHQLQAVFCCPHRKLLIKLFLPPESADFHQEELCVPKGRPAMLPPRGQKWKLHLAIMVKGSIML